MDKIEVCYSAKGQKYHKVVKDRNYAWSKCNLISSFFGKRQCYEFQMIEFDKNILAELNLAPCQLCFKGDG